MSERPVALVGPRGAGKTTVGRSLASVLGRTFVDLDDEVVRHANEPATKSAGALLAALGEQRFRSLEEQALEALLSDPGPFVLATGGGVVESASARARLAAQTLCIHLVVSEETRAARIAADATERPGLGAPDELIASVRAPLYRAAAAVELEADGRVERVVGELVRLIVSSERKVEGDGA